MTNLAKLGVAIAICKNDMHRTRPAAALAGDLDEPVHTTESSDPYEG
jgi:hypothetical protein